MFEAILMFVIVCVMGYASACAASESSERRQNHRAGTHDYYGNKLP